MLSTKQIAIGTVVGAMAFLPLCAAGAHAASPFGEHMWTAPRATALSDAKRAPRFIAAVRPGHHVTVPAKDCGAGVYTDFSVYYGTGKAFARQQRYELRSVWRGYTGTVTFDGCTFRSHSTHTVIVAAF